MNSRFSPAFSCHIGNLPSSRGKTGHRCRFRAATEEIANTSDVAGGVNITKYKSQRSIISTDKNEVTPEELNNLMVKAGNAVSLHILV